MSWIIQQLLRNSVEIKSTADINADDFNDLMIVEKKIKDLRDQGFISDEELSLIKYVEDSKPMVNSKEEFGKNRVTLAKDFVDLCNKIAIYLGGYFTDDGYIEYMRKKYRLSDDQVNTLLDFIKSKYKNKLIRKTNE